MGASDHCLVCIIAEEAFVVVNDYRQGDNAAYLYRQKTWAGAGRASLMTLMYRGYVLCFVQDPVEPRLACLQARSTVFMYPSTQGIPGTDGPAVILPSRPMTWLSIRGSSDLVIGTFGRALWVLDDIRPLRALANRQATMLLAERTDEP
ncbi:MAG: hypothetical protein MZV63_11540 [Marinilabiliales bacterium]|nr:hypothetical protein [Marinilabiliales bacterium]